MDNPIDFILASFDRVEESNKRSIAQQQATNALLKEATEQLRRSDKHLASAASRIETAAAKVPDSVIIKNKQEYGINLSTKLWLSAVLLALVLGFLFAPKAINTAEVERLKWELRNRESEIKAFREKNPKTANKYFGPEPGR